MKNIIYRGMCSGDEKTTFSLVEASFYEFVEEDLTEEGTAEFFRATREMIFEKPDGHFIFVAECDGEIIGMIDIRKDGHIGLFFVHKAYQGYGVGRSLLKSVQSCLSCETGMEVNSSLFAVKAYERLGFKKLKDVQTVNGIKFVPMRKVR